MLAGNRARPERKRKLTERQIDDRDWGEKARFPDATPIPEGARMCNGGVCGGRWAAMLCPSGLCRTCHKFLTVTIKDETTLRRIEAVGRATYHLDPTERTVAVGPLAMGAHGIFCVLRSAAGVMVVKGQHPVPDRPLSGSRALNTAHWVQDCQPSIQSSPLLSCRPISGSRLRRRPRSRPRPRSALRP